MSLMHTSCRTMDALRSYDDSIPAGIEDKVDQFKSELQACIECGQDFFGQRTIGIDKAVEYIVQSINEGELSDATLAQIVHAALLALDDEKQAVVAARNVRQAVQPFINEFVAGRADEYQDELLKGE